MARVLLDHIALGLPRIADAAPVLAGVLGGVPEGGRPSGVFDGFLHRFLAQRGPGVHHVTFKVPSTRAACDRTRALGLNPVGFDDSDPNWVEAFLHPKESLGIVVQFAESRGAESGSTPPQEPPPGVTNPPPPVTLLGLRLRAHSRERADRQWAQILLGEAEVTRPDEVTYRWPGSPMRLVVELSPHGDEGPLALEIASARRVPFSAGPHPDLGVTLTQR